MKDWKKLLYFSLPMTLIGIIDLLIVITDLFWIYFFSDSLEPISGIRISLAVLLLTEGIAVGLVSVFVKKVVAFSHQKIIQKNPTALRLLASS